LRVLADAREGLGGRRLELSTQIYAMTA